MTAAAAAALEHHRSAGMRTSNRKGKVVRSFRSAAVIPLVAIFGLVAWSLGWAEHATIAQYRLLRNKTIAVVVVGAATNTTTPRVLEKKEVVDKKRNGYPKTEQQQHQQQKFKDLANKALAFSEARKQSYQEEGRIGHWKLRGTGYLFAQKHILLATTLPEDDKSNIQNQRTTTATTTTLVRKVVRIDNVLPLIIDDAKMPTGGNSSLNIWKEKDYCSRLTIWVRVNGPEIFAGRALPVVDDNDDNNPKQTAACHWQFAFDLRVPGDYQVDAKVLVWNGSTDSVEMPNQGDTVRQRCRQKKGGPEAVTEDVLRKAAAAATAAATNSRSKSNLFYATTKMQDSQLNVVSGGFIGFKFYYPSRSCCEICSRTPACIHWATPPRSLLEAQTWKNGCELYFDKDHNGFDPDLVPSNLQSGLLPTTIVDATNNGTKNKVGRYHGNPASNRITTDEIAYYLGCGWSYWFALDFPCVSGDLDDRIYSNRNSFSFGASRNEGSNDKNPDQNYREDKRLSTARALPLCSAKNEGFERHKGRWIRLPFPSEEVCPNQTQIESKSWKVTRFEPEQPSCWYWDDMTSFGRTCRELNCKYLRRNTTDWISSLHKEKKWFGYWQNDDCDYQEFTFSQLQQCITERKISSIEYQGASVSGILKKYVTHRTGEDQKQSTDEKEGGRKKQRNRKRRRNERRRKDGSGTPSIIFYNSSLSDHKTVTVSTLGLLHITPDNHENLVRTFQSLPNSNSSHEYYFMSTFFLSSEREPLLYHDYQYNMSVLSDSILRDKGWTMLNAYDPSAAFTYDSAGQNDGMHLLGPPMKLVVTKLFHYMCSNSTVIGSRAGQIVLSTTAGVVAAS